MEGKNIVIEYRYAEGKLDRFTDLAAEMVRLSPDVIVSEVLGSLLSRSRQHAQFPLSRVEAIQSGEGLVTSLARPGGNITGLTNIAPDLAGKRLELLQEAVAKGSASGCPFVFRIRPKPT